MSAKLTKKPWIYRFFWNLYKAMKMITQEQTEEVKAEFCQKLEERIGELPNWQNINFWRLVTILFRKQNWLCHLGIFSGNFLDDNEMSRSLEAEMAEVRKEIDLIEKMLKHFSKILKNGGQFNFISFQWEARRILNSITPEEIEEAQKALLPAHDLENSVGILDEKDVDIMLLHVYERQLDDKCYRAGQIADSAEPGRYQQSYRKGETELRQKMELIQALIQVLLQIKFPEHRREKLMINKGWEVTYQ